MVSNRWFLEEILLGADDRNIFLCTCTVLSSVNKEKKIANNNSFMMKFFSNNMVVFR